MKTQKSQDIYKLHTQKKHKKTFLVPHFISKCRIFY